MNEEVLREILQKVSYLTDTCQDGAIYRARYDKERKLRARLQGALMAFLGGVRFDVPPQGSELYGDLLRVLEEAKQSP